MIQKIKQLFHIQKPSEPDIYEKIDNIFSELGGDTMSIKVGDDLINFGDMLINIVSNLRDDLNRELGFVLPAVHICNDVNLQENEYIIQVMEKTVFQDFIVPNIEGVEEIYGKLKDIVMSHIDDIMTNEITEKYIDTAQKKNGWLVWALSYRVSPPEIKIILTDILKAGHSIKNINRIFEKIGKSVFVENSSYYTNPHKISEAVISEL